MRIDLTALKHDHPIAEVIRGHGIDLRAMGARLAGRCPFHDDTRPSLVVYPATESFYCFGCGAGGDVITFLQRADGLDFREAVTRLMGSPPPHPPARPAPAADDATKLEERLVLTTACEVYHAALLRDRAALAYLAGRGIGMGLIRRGRLGYCDGRSLRPALARHRLSVRRAVDLGLLWARGGGEPLAGRIIVPELRGGAPIWLLGRALADTVQPRYWSISRPKPVLGYERVAGRPHVIVTEGPFDYLTAAGWGLPVCALLGTQIGAGRFGFLARAERVDLVFDADPAGRQAAAALAARLGERARIITLPDGVKDLSELGRRPDGRTIFLRLLAGADPPAAFGTGPDGAPHRATSAGLTDALRTATGGGSPSSATAPALPPAGAGPPARPHADPAPLTRRHVTPATSNRRGSFPASAGLTAPGWSPRQSALH